MRKRLSLLVLSYVTLMYMLAYLSFIVVTAQTFKQSDTVMISPTITQQPLYDTYNELPDSYIKEITYEDTIYEPMTLTVFYDDHYGSGLTIHDLTPDYDLGLMTYNGYVAIATATHLLSRVEPRYANVPVGFKQYDYFDIIDIVYRGQELQAIVIDSCGACSYDIDGNGIQRYDVLRADPTVDTISKERGYIISKVTYVEYKEVKLHKLD